MSRAAVAITLSDVERRELEGLARRARIALAAAEGLEQAIRRYIDTVNDNPRPFRWTKSADDILGTIKRFCLRTLKTAERQKEIIKTSESGH